MNNRNALIIGGSILLLAGGIYYFAVIRNKSTEEQFHQFKESSLKTGWDILDKISPAKEQEICAKFLKNLTRKEADRLIELSIKKESQMSVGEVFETKKLVNKWLRGYKTNQLK